MTTYIDSYGSIIREFDYPQDSVTLPFIRPSETFNVTSKTGKFVTKFIRLNMSMDIETTKLKVKKEWYSAPYIITTSLQCPHTNEHYVIHTFNWQDTQKLYDAISMAYGVGCKFWCKETHSYKEYGEFKKARRVLLCFVHNLSYEFSFMRSELKFAGDEFGFFTKDSRKAMKATLANGIDFRDSMALTNSSLVQLSKMYTLHKKKKDLDYDKPRNTKTPLSVDEKRYINEDVIILNEFEDVFFDRFCMADKMPPMTNTARLLLKVKAAMVAEKFDPKQVLKMQPSVDEIRDEQQYLFRGGFVHGNINYIDEVVTCLMRDITSSYPASMLMKYVPMTAFKSMKLSKTAWKYGDEPADFLYLMKNKCVKMTVVYYDLEATTEHSYESYSKLMEYYPYTDDPTQGMDNGRIQRCEMLKTMQTELDYEIYTGFYKWSAMEVVDIKYAERGMLPDFLLKSVAGDYKKKNDLKVAGLSGTTDYMLAKVDVNTYFGMCCKAIYSQNIRYDFHTGEWIPEETDPAEIKEEMDKRFLNYDWGVWITSQSRAKLCRMILAVEAVGGHVVYYDTDSLKYIPDKDGRTEQLFEAENERIAKERTQFPLLADPAFGGKSGKGLGEWDCEHKDFEGKPDTVLFKTLGAKRYLYHCKNGEWEWNKATKQWEIGECGWHLCVAGLPKQAVNHLPKDAFDFFSGNGFRFKGEQTGKLRPEYRDEPYDLTITDDYGNTETIHCESGVTLVPVDFDITSEKMYNIAMQKLQFRKLRRGF